MLLPLVETLEEKIEENVEENIEENDEENVWEKVEEIVEETFVLETDAAKPDAVDSGRENGIEIDSCSDPANI